MERRWKVEGRGSEEEEEEAEAADGEGQGIVVVVVEEDDDEAGEKREMDMSYERFSPLAPTNYSPHTSRHLLFFIFSFILNSCC